MAITNIQLVDAFRKFHEEHWGYVYGGQGQMWTEELAKKWQADKRSVPSGRNKSTYFVEDCARWIGSRVADCSGGIVQAIRQYDPKFGDRTANTFKSQFTVSGAIGTIPEIPGLAVWRSGHIGVYAGNGNALEFRGTNYGCVVTSLKSRDFTHWGKIKGVEYPVTETPVQVVTPTPTAQPRSLKLTDPMMRGEDVRELQLRLVDIGYAPGTADGVYGPQTEAAVKAFQARYLLTADGIVGPKTGAELRL